MNVYEKYTNDRFIRLLNSFLKKICEPSFKKEFGEDIKLSLYGIAIKSKNLSSLTFAELKNLQEDKSEIRIFIDTNPEESKSESVVGITFEDYLYYLFSTRGKGVLGIDFISRLDKPHFRLFVNQRTIYSMTYVHDENITEDITPSHKAVKNICDSEKFCKAQGKITFGQLKSIVESATNRRLFQHVGEGGYKATLRLLPWFLPQLAIAGFTGSILRAANKIFRPTLEETKGYKTWWGKTIMKMFDLVEGELGIEDPLSRIFFISDGLMTMLDDRNKVKFAKYIAEIASEKPDDEEVPEFFVENELRHWLNDKFLLNPPLPDKITNDDNQTPDKISEMYDKSNLFEEEDNKEKNNEKIERFVNHVISKFKSKIVDDNFLGYKALVGNSKYGETVVRIFGIFKKPFSGELSDKTHAESKKLKERVKASLSFLDNVQIYTGSNTTIQNFEDNLNFERDFLSRH